MTIVFLIACALSGYLYYLGGEEGYDTKYRDAGCAFIAVMVSIMLGFYSWPLILTFGLLWGALTMYWKFGADDAKWYHWAAHGLGCSLAWTPVAWYFGAWEGLVAYSIAVPVTFVVWSEIHDDVRIEAPGRGVALIFFLPLLLINLK